MAAQQKEQREDTVSLRMEQDLLYWSAVQYYMLVLKLVPEIAVQEAKQLAVSLEPLLPPPKYECTYHHRR